MAPSTDQVQAAPSVARAKGWLMACLHRARITLGPSRILRPVDLSPHLQRDVGLEEWPIQAGRRRIFELGEVCGRR